MKENPSVLINGAGPTGLLMAGQLAIRDVPFRIIDKNADHTTQSRALVVQARSLEIFDQMGIAQEALRLGEKAKAVGMIFNGKHVFRMDLGDVGEGLTAFPYLLILEQSKTEQILTDFLAHHGYRVERNTELLDFTQEADSVKATIKPAHGGEELVQVDWLVGADGAHSLVRQKLDIPFAGKTYQESLFVLDCKVDMDIPSDEMVIAFADKAFSGFFPLPNGRCRVLGTVPEGFDGQEAITFEAVAKNFAERIKLDVKLQNPEWIAVYSSHHRAVSMFRKGRAFIAGDAAHIHSPVGAQGMNTGLQDAYNLAWKLALVTQGKAREELLDTYNAERLAIAHNLVRTTDTAFQYVNSQNPLLKGLRMTIMPRVLPILWPIAQRQRAIRELGFKTISEIGINYRKSPLSQEDEKSHFPRHAPKPGDRVPYIPTTNQSKGSRDFVTGTQYHLVLFSGQAVDEGTQKALQQLQKTYADLIKIDEVPASEITRELYKAFGVQHQGFYFIRPDGYIAYRSTTNDMRHFASYLKRYFLERFSREYNNSNT